MLHCHLARRKLNMKCFGLVDDLIAELVVGSRRSQADLGSALCPEIPKILVQLKVGPLARGNLPAYDDCQGKKSQPENQSVIP